MRSARPICVSLARHIGIEGLRREEPTVRVGALIMGWRVGELLQSIEGVK